jgi:MHS family shikimate/dehydroshikimate transporter-like MFS transporter
MERSMTVADNVEIGLVPDHAPSLHTPSLHAPSLQRIVWSSVIGTAVEWYDFLIYGAATALVFNKIFFPAGNATLATIAAFGTYAIGFLARPLGAAIFGHYGDRIGRKAMLAVTIIVMGLGTFLIGLLPNYQQIGIAAPVLLVALRFLQGIGGRRMGRGGADGGRELPDPETGPVGEHGAGRQPRRQPGRDRHVRPGRAPAGKRLPELGLADPVPSSPARRCRSLHPAKHGRDLCFPAAQGQE